MTPQATDDVIREWTDPSDDRAIIAFAIFLLAAGAAAFAIFWLAETGRI